MRSMMTRWMAPGDGAALATCVIAAVATLAEKGESQPGLAASLRTLVADAMRLSTSRLLAPTELRIEDPLGIPDTTDAGRVNEVLRRHIRGSDG